MAEKLKKLLECLRCGWTWTPKGKRKPKSCPGCKQYQWDKKATFGAAA